MGATDMIVWIAAAAFSTACSVVAIRYAVIARRAARRAEDHVGMMRRRIK